MSRSQAVGLDFGTTNSVVAVSDDARTPPRLLTLDPATDGAVFRSALCFWQDAGARGRPKADPRPTAREQR